MQHTSAQINVWTELSLAVRNTRETVAWIWFDIIDVAGRRAIRDSLLLSLLSSLILLSAAYPTKLAIDAVAQSNTATALWWIIFGGGGILLSARLVDLGKDIRRERAWNENFRSVVTSLTRIFLAHTTGELTSNDEIGPSQIESAWDHINSILELLFFGAIPKMIIMISGCLLLASIDALAAGGLVVMLVFNLAWFSYFNAKVSMETREVSRQFRQFGNRLTEWWYLFFSTKSAGVEDKILQQADEEVQVPLRGDWKAWSRWIKRDVIRSLVNLIGATSILVFGVTMSRWSAGDLAAVSVWISLVTDQFSSVGSDLRHITKATTKLTDIRSHKPPNQPSRETKVLSTPETIMHITFDSVSLQYPDSDHTLRNISLEIPRGCRLAVMGESGAGKSSLGGLLRRDFDPTAGRILINGRDLREYNLASVLRYIGVIPQRPEVFSGTVRENLLHGIMDPTVVSDETLWELIGKVSPGLQVRFKQHQLDTRVGKHGMELSGGEQQRLCVIRSLVEDPRHSKELLIIDEATSALDSGTELVVQEGIDAALSRGMSAIVIAHRFSTLRGCNRFLCLRKLAHCADGESQIEAVTDSTKELYAQSSWFRHQADLQGFHP
jgi:ABC-type multidrug transport system fused ATPase/permease subunit